MEKISIICLIYQSPQFAEFVYNNLMKHTPELSNGEAEFYFVANDATDEVINYLKEKNYPHYINNNIPKYTEQELFKMGFAFPEYINRVYRGYNFGIKQSNNPIIVLINSDNCFSPNWLSNLKKRLTEKMAVSPRMIQPTGFRNPINNSHCDIYQFGTTINTFNEEAFLKKVNELTRDEISIGNAFMPVMIYKSIIEKAGYYPEGNLHAGSYNRIRVTGDTEFFSKLNKIGVKHITSNDSIIYHLNEGEKHKKI